jgi:hypothetical protein
LRGAGTDDRLYISDLDLKKIARLADRWIVRLLAAKMILSAVLGKKAFRLIPLHSIAGIHAPVQPEPPPKPEAGFVNRIKRSL